MQRVAAVLVVVLAGGAYADVKGDIEKLVRANIKAVAADRRADFERTTVAGAMLVLPDGRSAIETGLVADFYGAKAKKVAHKVESLKISVDAEKKVAWFHGAIVATFVADKVKTTLPMRIAGIAVDDGGWRIQAVMYAKTITDKELAGRAAAATRGAAKASGEAAITKLVGAWFAAGGSIANDRSKNVAVVVNGTSPVEIGDGAFAVKLVKAWDGLKLWATSVEATAFANGEVAFARADVMMPVKEQAAKMVLGVILVKENAVWRWVSLCFTPG